MNRYNQPILIQSGHEGTGSTPTDASSTEWLLNSEEKSSFLAAYRCCRIQTLGDARWNTLVHSFYYMKKSDLYITKTKLYSSICTQISLQNYIKEKNENAHTTQQNNKYGVGEREKSLFPKPSLGHKNRIIWDVHDNLPKAANTCKFQITAAGGCEAILLKWSSRRSAVTSQVTEQDTSKQGWQEHLFLHCFQLSRNKNIPG